MGNKEAFKLFLKVWSAYTKYILKQWMQKRWFVSPFIGSFFQNESDNKKFHFIPNKEFLEAGKFKYETASEDKGSDDKYFGKYNFVIKPKILTFY